MCDTTPCLFLCNKIIIFKKSVFAHHHMLSLTIKCVMIEFDIVESLLLGSPGRDKYFPTVRNWENEELRSVEL